MSKNSLTIHIENPQLYTTGDTVKGNVELLVEEKLDLESIEVELLGMAKSHNHTYVNGSYVSGTESHKLLQLTSKVFPPPDVQLVSASKRFTLGAGSHVYPFEFTFPGKEHVAQCIQDKKRMHSRTYVKKEVSDHVTLVGSFFYEQNSEDYCMVQYSVNSCVVVPSMFKFNIKTSETVYFAPRNSEIYFSLRHLCEKKVLLPDEDYTCETVKYGISEEAKMSKGFSRIFSSNTVKVPYELKVRFKADALDTSVGTTARILQGCGRLSNFVDLDLLTPFSSETLVDALGGTKKGMMQKPPVAKITHVKVKLLSFYQFLGTTESYSKSTTELLNQDLDVEVPLGSFERVDYTEQGLFNKVPSKLTGKMTRNTAYRLSLDPSWWDCYVSDESQSFLTCGMKKDVVLYVRLTLVSPDNPEKVVKIKSSSPVILYRQEGSDMAIPHLFDGNEEQLPSYMPAPPGYDSDSDRKSIGKEKR